MYYILQPVCMNTYDIADIGIICLDKKIEDEKKLMFLNKTWTPMYGFVFPVIKQGKQNRSFQMEWLNIYKWLAYSDLKKGGFCKYCVLFPPSGGGKGSQVIFFSYL